MLQAPPVQLEQQARLARRAQPEPQEPQARQVRRDRLVPQEQQARLGPLVQVVQLERPEPRVLTVPLARLVRRDR